MEIFPNENCSRLDTLERELSRLPAPVGKKLRDEMKKAIKSAANKFSKHVDAHPARALWESARVFNPWRQTVGLDNAAPFGLHENPAVSRQLYEYQAVVHPLSVPPGWHAPLARAPGPSDVVNFWENAPPRWAALAAVAQRAIWLPVSSAAVERSFAVYKRVVSDHRLAFTEQSTRMWVMLVHNGDIADRL